MRLFQTLYIALIAASLALVVGLSAGAHSPLRMVGGTRFVMEAAASLPLYGVLLILAPRLVHFRCGLSTGFFVGTLSGLCQVVHMSLEMFGTHVGERSGLTLAFMAGSFALWGASALRVGLRGAKPAEAVFAAIISAMTTMIIAVAYGILLSGLGYPDADYVGTWPEFVRSGWTDARSFATANSFEAAASHFLVAPIVAVIVGGIGYLISLPFRRRTIQDKGQNA